MEHVFNSRLLFALFVFVIWAYRAVKAAVDKAAAAREDRPVARGPHGEPIDPDAADRQRKDAEERKAREERKAGEERKAREERQAREERSAREEWQRRGDDDVARQLARRPLAPRPGSPWEASQVGRVALNPPGAAAAAPPVAATIRLNEPVLEELPLAPLERPEVAVYPPLIAAAPLTAAPLVLPPLVTGYSAAPVMATAALSAAWSDTARAADRERWSTASGNATARVSLEDLRDPAAVRQAVLLREILGPPVALR